MSDLTDLAPWFLIAGYAIGSVCAALVALACVRTILAAERWADATPAAPADRVITEWAADAGYDLVGVSGGLPADSPVATEYGFARWHRPGRVWRVQVRDGRHRLHRGWVFVAGRPADRGGFTPEFLEVAWDE